MAQTNLIGKTVLGYTVVEKIESGAFGTVYKAVKTNVSGSYIRALKHIRIPNEKQYISVLNSMGGDIAKADHYFAEMLRGIISEIQILNRLSESGGQHIVRYYENDITEANSPKRYDIYILMEYLTPLEEVIGKKDLRVRDVVNLGFDILRGLHFCHENGVIHRDIKEDNIFISEKGEYKIGDFGVSKTLKGSSKVESLKGTPNFLAPEVYLGKAGYTKSVDLYSLGVVLYRLLNYNRNPFLPSYPEPFTAEDEDTAFKKRMSGVIPPMPAFGGEYIGVVVLKALAKSTDRFESAEEFFCALKEAQDQTKDAILDESVSFNAVAAKDTVKKAETYGETMGETAPSEIFEETIHEEYDDSLNRHLFESIGEKPKVNIQKSAVSVTKIEQGKKKDYSNAEQHSVNPRVCMNGLAIPAVKKMTHNIVLAVPGVLVLVGIVAGLVVLPGIYGKTVSLVEWLFSGSQNIVDTLQNADIVLPQIYSIAGIQIFWRVWLAVLSISVFFAGKQLHKKPEPDAEDAVLIKKEPYLIVLDVYETLKRIKSNAENKEFNALIYAVKCLEEKLAVESDFGYGKQTVIDCENEIAALFRDLSAAVMQMEIGNENVKATDLHEIVRKINSLMRRRAELKKK